VKKLPHENERPQFLTGWKEIANYLGKGVRTVQRYERELGLPVRRPAGKDKGSVIAVVAEIDGWVKASPIREVFQLRSATREYPSPAQIFKEGLSELATLREQMSMLRSEITDSVQRLQNSVQNLQGEVSIHRDAGSIPPPTLFSSGTDPARPDDRGPDDCQGKDLKTQLIHSRTKSSWKH
jgi:hypothetical protein